MNRIALITTKSDKSATLFISEVNKKWFHFLFIDYSIDNERFSSQLVDFNPDLLYLRDPFNTLNYSLGNIQNKVEICKSINANYIDQTSDIEDLLFEDKWVQYQKFSKYQAKTELFVDKASFKSERFIYKPRISSRGRGINFDQIPPVDGSYIQQEKLLIIKEFRIFVVSGEILPQIALRSSKTENSKVKQRGVFDIKTVSGLEDFVDEIMSLIKFDLVGLDVAVLNNNEFKLIEVNRSPQFSAYFRDSGTNPAEIMLRKYRSLFKNYTSNYRTHF